MGQDGSIVFLMKVMNIFCKKYIKMEKNKEQDFINRYKMQEIHCEGNGQGIRTGNGEQGNRFREV